MFYDGDLQSGISLALQESKYAILLVRDDSDVSSAWEQIFADEEVTTKLQQKAIVFRINAGSQEAGFLSVFCPIDNTQLPTLVVVKDGQLLSYLTVGTQVPEVKARLLASVGEGSKEEASQEQQESNPPAQQTAARTSQTQQERQVSAQASQPAQTRSNLPAQEAEPGPSEPRPSEPQTEAQRRASIRAGKQPATEEDRDSKKAEIERWTEEQRKITQQRDEERQRIRERIKQDERERKLETAKKRDEVHKKTAATMRPPSLQPMSTLTPQPVRLQVRLFDGESIHKFFEPEKTIQDDVRPWIDQKRADGARRYNLKQVMAPCPNRVFTSDEERMPLSDLKLSTNANMVIVPDMDAASPTLTESSSVIVNRAFAGYNFVLSLIMGLIGLIAWFLGFRENPDAEPGTAVQSTGQPPRETPRVQPVATASASGSGARASGGNIRTLADQRREERDEEFYNGNQLNFQPRGPDDDEDL